MVSVNISEKKGTVKKAVPEIRLRLRHGIEGDAHAGDWHRQISLLAEESVDTMRAACAIPLDSGVFAENINTREIKKVTGTCVRPTEGIFAVVVREGRVRKGDPIEILGEGET